MILQLNPPLRLFVPGKGPGSAHLVIDYGEDHDLYWVIILDRSGEVWTISNKEVRGIANETMGRPGETFPMPEVRQD